MRWSASRAGAAPCPLLRSPSYAAFRAIIDATFAVEQQLVDAGLQVTSCFPLLYMPVFISSLHDLTSPRIRYPTNSVAQEWPPVLAIEQLLRQPLIYALQCKSGSRLITPFIFLHAPQLLITFRCPCFRATRRVADCAPAPGRRRSSANTAGSAVPAGPRTGRGQAPA